MITSSPVAVAIPSVAPRARLPESTRGLLYGLTAVATFSLTPTCTRIAVLGGLPPFFAGVGRAFGAALLAAPLLLLTRQPRPRRSQLGQLAVVGVCLGVGFPLLIAWALRAVPATHVAAVFGLLPLATSIAGALRAGERASRLFWVAGATGSSVVFAYAWQQGGGQLGWPDAALFLAVALCAAGYTEGALLAPALGGWQVISWALVLVAPITGSLAAAGLAANHGAMWRALTAGTVTTAAWISFGYVTVCSQWLGLFVWYRGLSLGGVSRVGQLQLLMPFMTVGASMLLLGERITIATILTALAVVATVAVGRRATVTRLTK